MLHIIRTSSTMIIFILLQACSENYYGHTIEQWDNLSHDEQIAIRKDYQMIIDSRASLQQYNIIKARDQSIIDRAKEGLRR